MSHESIPYRCECGKEFTDSQSFNGHKSHCRIHLGEERWLLHEQRMQKYHEAGLEAREQKLNKKQKEQLLSDATWVSEQHICERCGKIMTEKFGSGRFCSRTCANKNNIKKKQQETRICVICGQTFMAKQSEDKKCCSSSCSREYFKRQHYEAYLHDNSIAYGQQNMQSYKKYFLEEQQHRCAICGLLDFWQDKPLVFILDHIDGNADNNKRENLRLICPNCDSQLITYKSKNKNSARAKYRKKEKC